MIQESSIKSKEKIKNWLNDYHNLLFILILIIALGFRLYYFSITKSQPLWWDESDYMAYAKTLAGYSTTWLITPHHTSLLPYIIAGLFKLGASEQIIRFLLELLPSFLIIFFVYKICFFMYKDKKIALISTFLMAVLSEALFNSMRFHLETPALFFALFSIYVFWQGYERKEKIFGKINSNWAIPLTVFFVILTYAIRRGYFLIGGFFLIYMLLTKRITVLIKDKYNWYALIIAIVGIFLIETFIFTSSVGQVASLFYNEGVPFNLSPFQVFKAFFNNFNYPIFSVFTYLFWIGLLILVLKLMLSIGYFKRETVSLETKADLFNFISIILTLSFFLFYSRSTTYGESRWYFLLLLASFICVSKSAVLITDYIKKYSKTISIILLVFIIGFGGYYELSQATTMIKQSSTSYEGIKQAGLFIKQVSSPGDIVISVPMPQAAYYSERDVKNPARLLNVPSNSNVSLEMFLSKLSEKDSEKVKYLIVTFSEPGHPDWMQKTIYTDQNQIAIWQIPFMNTTINFLSGDQDIKESQKYGNLEFKLLAIKEDAFVYEILRK